MSSSTNDTNEDLLYELADEFVSRHQKGEAPSLDEYCERHPELTARIRKLFPTMVALEGSKQTPPTFDLEEVGNYRLIREIGRGGMGVVYEAQHETLGRRVAVKVLPQGMAMDGRALARFQREA
ncbi:MAG: serine/threonine protein kinase, partial [Planctomycetota bacterium]